ncbi:hypothetical protein HY995_02785, partial [Candidatus Micrarchaeota archaeon]|nr:hypothetical protein [Candidatus Micrarchaeota archaeon]
MIDYVFASDGKIRNDQEEIAPVSKTRGMRFYDSKSGVPQDEKDAMDYQSGAILLGPDADGHAIVWDASLDLRK